MSKLVINSDFPVGNAAGWCKDLAEVKRLAQSAASFITVGSITVAPREGNPGQTFYQDGPWALNSIGLKNPGIGYIREVGEKMVAAAHEAKKPIILSGAGDSPADYEKLAEAADEVGFDGFEINGGCPNKVDGAVRHRIVSFEPKLVDDILRAIPRRTEMFFTFKVSPMTDPEQIQVLAEVITPYSVSRRVLAVVTMNAVPNCLLYDKRGQLAIQTPDKTGWAGFSGSAIKPFALGQVNQWRKVLLPSMQVWGVGAVSNGTDVLDMQCAGASVVQVGTAYFIGGAKVFGGIASEFINLNERGAEQ